MASNYRSIGSGSRSGPQPRVIAVGSALIGLTGVAFAGGPIQDNSFLVEEAYNQEAGVVQHIMTFQRDLRSDAWVSSFTQEWPLFGQANQLSYTVPMAATTGSTGLGDIALNWRYQLVGDGEQQLAVSPRLSLLLPTGKHEAGRGIGAAAGQFNLPISVVAAAMLVAHVNVGVTIAPSAPDDATGTGTMWAANYSVSAIWLATHRFNAMLEVAGTRSVGPANSASTDNLYISPGVRAAIDIGVLQVVPGFAIPIGVGSSSGEVSAFLYLSFEHPFVHQSPPLTSPSEGPHVGTR